MALDKGLCTSILLTDLSKAFDCISRDLLIAKLHAYGFSRESLRLVNDYLCDRKKWTKIGTTFSSWRNIIYGVPQGSILGPFSHHFDMANYADDFSPYEYSCSIEDDIQKLQNDSQCLIKWYESNYLKPNRGKWHLLITSSKLEIMIFIIVLTKKSKVYFFLIINSILPSIWISYVKKQVKNYMP